MQQPKNFGSASFLEVASLEVRSLTDRVLVRAATGVAEHDSRVP